MELGKIMTTCIFREFETRRFGLTMVFIDEVDPCASTPDLVKAPTRSRPDKLRGSMLVWVERACAASTAPHPGVHLASRGRTCPS